jgi:4-carboxymuconolactone decarboxylase
MTDMRIPPLPPDQRDPRTEEVLADLRGGATGDMNLFATLAHHPRLLKRWTAFGGTLLRRGELPGRDRELLILRTAANTGAAYEWGHHVPIARRAGVSDEEMARLAAPSGRGSGEVGAALDESAWSAEDAALLRAADELHTGNRISDGTWAQLASRYDEAQLIEVCMVVGQYHLVAFTLNSLGIQPEPGLEPLP